MSTQLNSSNNVDVSTSAQLLPMQCCVQYGDCLTHLSNMDDNEVSYTITSPPYNVGTVKGKSKYQNTKDNYTQDEYFEWSKNVINELLRVTENEVFYNIQMLTNNKVALMKILGHFAEQVKEIIIWDKKNGEPAIEKGVMNSVFEFIIVFSKNNADKRKFYTAKFHGTFDNILRHKKQSGNEITTLNSATFPNDLVRKLLLAFTNENDLILDPFTGSGTTAIGCIDEKRRFVGFEIDKEIYDYATKRIINKQSQTTLW